MTLLGHILVTIFTLCIVVVVHEWGHLMVALYLGVRVERFTVGFGPELFGWTSARGIRYAVCAVPLGGMVKMAGEFVEERTQSPDEFFSQAWYRRIAIALAGPLMNYVLAFLLFAVVSGFWGVMRPSTQPVIGDVLQGSPAATSKLLPGDRVASIDGQAVTSWEQMARLVHEKPEQAVRLEIDRSDGTASTKRLTIHLTPKRDAQSGRGLIGVMPDVERVKPGLRGSFSAALKDLQIWTVQPLKYLGQKIVRLEAPKDLSGPLGIFRMVSKSVESGWYDVLYLLAIISTGLGMFNLFPIPVLDGGHVMLYTIEGIIRRPLSQRFLQVANAIGLSLLVTVLIFATWHDVLRERLGFWK